MKSKISIWIPIDLSNRQEIAAALERKYGTEYVFVDGVFQSTINNERCEVTICDRQTWKELNQDLNLLRRELKKLLNLLKEKRHQGRTGNRQCPSD